MNTHELARTVEKMLDVEREYAMQLHLVFHGITPRMTHEEFENLSKKRRRARAKYMTELQKVYTALGNS